MTEPTIQDYVTVLSQPHTLFWDGHCKVGKQQPGIRLALAAERTGALGVLLFADPRRDAWLVTSGLTALVQTRTTVLNGTGGYVLKLSFAGNTASGSLSFPVSDKGNLQRRRVSFSVKLTKLSGPPGRPHENTGIPGGAIWDDQP